MKYLKAIAVTAAFMLILSGCDSPIQPSTDQIQSATSDELSLAKKGNNNNKGVNSRFECTDVAPLMTGKNVRAGSVSVTNDGSTLYVMYTVTDGWTLTKTHLNISRGIFTRHDGSGRVNVKQNHASGTTTYTYAIPMQWSAGSKVYIKAHADVKKNKTNDVAYGGKNGKKHKGHWFAFFRYLIKGVPPATYDISGITYIDENSNGEQDTDEEGLAGVSLSLSNGSTTVSDLNGEYSFSGLSNGIYTVTAGVMSGYTLATAASVPLTISGTNQTADFGYTLTVAPPATYSLSGYVFVDANDNGVKDAGEEGLAGINAELQNGSTATTDGDGAYVFTGLIDGSYTVTIPDQKGFAALTPLTQNITIAGFNQSLDFRFGTLLLSISGVLFHDMNNNGLRDSGEPGIAGGTVALYSNNGAWLETTTDANGFYSFNDLTADTYLYEFFTEGYQPPPDYYLYQFDLTTESLTVDWAMTESGSGG
jgi:hypothetical protein